MANVVINECEDMDQLFRESREYFNDLFIKKMAVNSVYYGRIDVQSWPLNSLPEQAAFRFSRGWYNPTAAWKEVNSGRCVQDSCDNDFETIAHPPTEKYTFKQLRKDMRTDWYCLTDFMYRLFPAEEMEHIQATNANISRNVHEEFVRTSYIATAGHRWLGIAQDDSLISCEVPSDDMFIFKEYEGTGEGGFDATYVYVKLPSTQLADISLLGYDQLDDVLQDLMREDDAYRLDVSEALGRRVLEVIVPDPKTFRYLWQYVKQDAGWYGAETDFDDKQLQYSLGIERVVGNYAFAYDINALRYNIDYAYNGGLGAFNATDIDTWPRLKRVLPYVAVPTEMGGCKYIQNTVYKNADFGITVPWVNNVVTKWMPPGFTGVGDAQGQVQNYAGEWQWKNPDYECNIKRNQGFFWAQFRMAFQSKDPTMQHAILHRLNKSRILPAACCDVNYTYYSAPADCFACIGVSEEGI